MQDRTYLPRNFPTFGPLGITAAVYWGF